MLSFTRNKLASVYRKDAGTLSVHGVMEDDVYGLEVDLDLSLSGLEILSISGKWNRMENSKCPRALPFLQEAVGLRMDEEFVQKVQKIVGRKACRHFADLILECCDAAGDAARLILGEQPGEELPGAEIEGLFGETGSRGKAGLIPAAGGKEDKAATEDTGGVVIDLHVHSYPASPCSSISLQKVVKEAREAGLDGVCLTDHNHLWDQGEIERLRQELCFLILRGNEVTTDQGDILVFGLDEDIVGIIKLEELRKKVLEAGGFMIAAHPFRGFLTFGIGHLGLTPEKAMERPLFKQVDALEVLNSKVAESENNFAARVAAGLQLPVTGGSDAHSAGEVGLYATLFPGRINNERDLVEALKAGGYSPVALGKR